MPTVTNTLKAPDGSLVSTASVQIELAGTDGVPIKGYVTAGDYSFIGYHQPTVTAGVWSVSLVANTLINPAGTRWKVSETYNSRTHIYYLLVPDGVGPYFVEDILDEVPGTVASSALSAHIAATTDVHGIADTSGVLATSLRVPAALFIASGGSPVVGYTGSTAAERWPCWLLDSSTTEAISASVWVPFHWTTCDVSVLWTQQLGTTSPVVWRLDTNSAAAGDNINGTGTVGSEVTSASVASEAFASTTVVSGLAVDPNDCTLLRLNRVGGAAADTLNVDAQVVALVLSQAS